MKKITTQSDKKNQSPHKEPGHLLHDMEQFLHKNKLAGPDSRLLVGVSGGVDSIVLVHLLKQAGFAVSIAHCNFQLRGKESDADERFVKQLAKKWKLDCYAVRFDTANLAEATKKSIQETARSLRYTWFEELRKTKDIDLICTAHHLDDSIETFFINLLRGTGIKGLMGIPVKNNKIIRPLLFAPKANLVAYAQENKLAFREDSSNKTDAYLRNKIRHQVIPLFEKENPSFRNTMGREMNYLLEAGQIVQEAVKNTRKKLLKKQEQGWSINRHELMQVSPLGIYLFELLNPFGFNSSMTDDLIQILNSNRLEARILYSADYELQVERTHLFLAKRVSKVEESAFFVTEGNKKYTAPFSFQTHILKRTPGFQIPKEAHIGCFDLTKLHFPLLLRKWKNGDRLQPLGMKGTKLLSDFFSEKKFSRKMKSDCWVLESEGQIVWIAGYRIAEHVKISPTAKHIFKISIG
jgi:tRNA(Ile)-lysidine synthase